MATPPFVSELRVRYAETDQMGVVHHANYLLYCEVGRTDFLRSLGTSYADLEKEGVRLPVAEVTIRYHASARYDDHIRVETTLSRRQIPHGDLRLLDHKCRIGDPARDRQNHPGVVG